MKKSTYQLEFILNLNERLFLNALQDVSEDQAKERISARNNPLIWVAAHTVLARYNMLAFL